MNYNQTGIDNSTFGDNNQFNIHQTINVPRQSKPIPSNVRLGSKNFVGRVPELEEIHAKLEAGHDVAICAVEGMGGIGKTELALQYAHKYKDTYAAQYWLPIRDKGLAAAVKKLLTTKNIYLRKNSYF